MYSARRANLPRLSLPRNDEREMGHDRESRSGMKVQLLFRRDVGKALAISNKCSESLIQDISGKLNKRNSLLEPPV